MSRVLGHGRRWRRYGAVDQIDGGHTSGRIFRIVWLVILLVTIDLGSVPLVRADAINWRVTPMRLRVVCQFAVTPMIPSAWRQQIPERLIADAALTVPTGWSIEDAMLAEGLDILLADDDEPTSALVELPAAWTVSVDQIVFLKLSAAAVDGYTIEARALDMATWSAGPRVTRQVELPALLMATIDGAVRDALVPIVEIESVEPTRSEVLVRLRGDRLSHEAEVPQTIGAGDFLQPVIAVPDRHGKLGREGVRPVSWTLLRVVDQQPDGSWRCEMQSGYGRPLRTQKSRRARQLAYRVSPPRRSTRLQLVYRDRDATPRTGCQVFAQAWGQSKLVPLGRTDWLGDIRIPEVELHESPGQVVVVRYGDRLVAKLPMVVGAASVARVELPDDRPLIDVELFLGAIEQDLIDLLARRELMALRVRRFVAAGNADQAESLIDQLRQMDNQSDFLRRIETKQRSINVSSDALRQRIDKAFLDTRQILSRLLTTEFVQRLQDEVAQVRSSAQ